MATLRRALTHFAPASPCHACGHQRSLIARCLLPEEHYCSTRCSIAAWLKE